LGKKLQFSRRGKIDQNCTKLDKMLILVLKVVN